MVICSNDALYSGHFWSEPRTVSIVLYFLSCFYRRKGYISLCQKTLCGPRLQKLILAPFYFSRCQLSVNRWFVASILSPLDSLYIDLSVRY